MREVRPAVLLAAVPRPRVPRARGHVRNRDDVGCVPSMRPGAPAVLDVRAPRRLCVILYVCTGRALNPYFPGGPVPDEG